MKKNFYSHLVAEETIHVELDALNLSDEQKKRLVLLIESTMHHHVLDTVLSELSDSEKKEFLDHLDISSHETIWDFLRGKFSGAEERIKAVVDALTEELREDIKKSK